MIKNIFTLEQLRQAQQQGLPEIQLVGDIADKLKAAQQVARLGHAGASLLGAALGSAVMSGLQRPSQSKLSRAMEKTGASMSSILSTTAIGASLVFAIFSQYEEIEYEKGKLTLRRSKDSVMAATEAKMAAAKAEEALAREKVNNPVNQILSPINPVLREINRIPNPVRIIIPKGDKS